ncbi:MAG: circularly permuted type 2 ATP-grasp protein [Pseudomonadota bacterium]
MAYRTEPKTLVSDYSSEPFFDELFGQDGARVDACKGLVRGLETLDLRAFKQRTKAVDQELRNLGITFTVYKNAKQIDRVLPFDAIPRIITADEWQTIEAGVQQRVAALNLFLDDIYNAQTVFKDGVLPAALALKNSNYRREMQGRTLPFGTWVNICGTDLVRGGDGAFYVLEDNARTPSGVSYVVENRHLTQRTFPDLMRNIKVRPVSDYGQRLIEGLSQMWPGGADAAEVALLSPGVYNSAYFEHVFLAREMGVPLVEGRDLRVEDDIVYMKTTAGLQRLNVIYRRIDDDFLDPKVFRKDSLLGVPGIMQAFSKGNVILANAVGTGVADDKAIYAYMPRIIRHFLGEDPILNNVETHICREPDALQYTLENLENLVVKPVGESGGYGVVIGPKASKKLLNETRQKLKKNPSNFISQPVLQLSTCPTLTKSGVEPRHVDLRPFAITGESTWVLPGGLTRVALKKGSLVVNSSQGGGSKDTWVLA